jgi:capsular polysaccharide biosynthesis protein
MVLLKDGRLIAETNYLQHEAIRGGLCVDESRLVHATLKYPAAACFDHWDTNYYHWMTHGVATLQAIMERHPGGDIGLVLPELLPWQRELIAAMGAESLPSITTASGRQYHFSRLEYYDTVRGSADYAMSRLRRDAYARLQSGMRPARTGETKLYIDRTRSPNRQLQNESSLIAALNQLGFVAVRLEEHSFLSQRDLFRSARMVVGLHGAGLSNIAFCQPGTIVYELVAENYRNPCFLAMAMNLDLEYWADAFPTGGTLNDYLGPWSTPIDISRVVRRIVQLVQRPTGN